MSRGTPDTKGASDKDRNFTAPKDQPPKKLGAKERAVVHGYLDRVKTKLSPEKTEGLKRELNKIQGKIEKQMKEIEKTEDSDKVVELIGEVSGLHQKLSAVRALLEKAGVKTSDIISDTDTDEYTQVTDDDIITPARKTPPPMPAQKKAYDRQLGALTRELDEKDKIEDTLRAVNEAVDAKVQPTKFQPEVKPLKKKAAGYRTQQAIDATLGQINQEVDERQAAPEVAEEDILESKPLKPAPKKTPPPTPAQKKAYDKQLEAMTSGVDERQARKKSAAPETGVKITDTLEQIGRESSAEIKDEIKETHARVKAEMKKESNPKIKELLLREIGELWALGTKKTVTRGELDRMMNKYDSLVIGAMNAPELKKVAPSEQEKPMPLKTKKRSVENAKNKSETQTPIGVWKEARKETETTAQGEFGKQEAEWFAHGDTKEFKEEVELAEAMGEENILEAVETITKKVELGEKISAVETKLINDSHKEGLLPLDSTELATLEDKLVELQGQEDELKTKSWRNRTGIFATRGMKNLRSEIAAERSKLVDFLEKLDQLTISRQTTRSTKGTERPEPHRALNI